MQTSVVFCIFLLVGLALGETSLHPRGCIYINGKCFKDCEEGTHAYTTGCGFLKKEPTCEDPVPQEDKSGHLCDYSACYCDPPTVRNTQTKTCVKLEDCPKTEKA